jgi:hypothetical protein
MGRLINGNEFRAHYERVGQRTHYPHYPPRGTRLGDSV